MNIEKIANKFKKHGVSTHATKTYAEIVIYNSLKHITAPVFTTLFLTKNKLVMECIGDAETHGYRQVLTNQREIVSLLNIFYQYVRTNVKLENIPLKIQEKVIANGEAVAIYFDGKCAYTIPICEIDGHVLVDGEFLKSGNIEILKDLTLSVNHNWLLSVTGDNG